MSNSLREKLLGLGFKAPEPEVRPKREERRPAGDARPARPSSGKRGPERSPPGRAGAGKPGSGKPGAGRPDKPGERRGPRPPRSREDIDLAKAYAIRAQREKDERIEAERVRQEEARVRREAKAKLAAFLQDKALNDPAAEIARHFPYGGKIKRIHVTEAQLKALNAGELGVLQLDGRYLLVASAVLAEAEAIFAPAVALKVDPDAPVDADPYADPRFEVPDDLVW